VKKIMVTGGRHWTNRGLVLDSLAAYVPADATILVGDAPGVDAIVRQHWPTDQTREFKANWKAYGNGAGPRRNQEMVDTMPDLVLAFPDTCTCDRRPGAHWSHGTADAMRRARLALIRVKVISDPDAVMG
jgi:hypothetical protein